MGLKKSSKPSAEFNLSSLTDIIFLLLIFFMLTSKLVKIQPFELPKSDSKTVAATNIVVTIDKSGVHKLNDVEIAPANMQALLSVEALPYAGKIEMPNVTIVAEVGTPFDYVVAVMEAASLNKMKAIIATQPKS